MHPREPSGGLGPTAPTPYPRGGRRRTPPSRPATRRRASTSSGTSRARPPRPASRRGARRRPSNDNAAPRQHSRRLTGDRPAGRTTPRPEPVEVRRKHSRVGGRQLPTRGTTPPINHPGKSALTRRRRRRVELFVSGTHVRTPRNGRRDSSNETQRQLRDGARRARARGTQRVWRLVARRRLPGWGASA